MCVLYIGVCTCVCVCVGGGGVCVYLGLCINFCFSLIALVLCV